MTTISVYSAAVNIHFPRSARIHTFRDLFFLLMTKEVIGFWISLLTLALGYLWLWAWLAWPCCSTTWAFSGTGKVVWPQSRVTQLTKLVGGPRYCNAVWRIMNNTDLTACVVLWHFDLICAYASLSAMSAAFISKSCVCSGLCDYAC